MRLKTPRIAPVSLSELSEEQKAALGPRFDKTNVFNVFRTIARAPRAFKRFMVWGGYILSDRNDLPRVSANW